MNRTSSSAKSEKCPSVSKSILQNLKIEMVILEIWFLYGTNDDKLSAYDKFEVHPEIAFYCLQRLKNQIKNETKIKYFFL